MFRMSASLLGASTQTGEEVTDRKRAIEAIALLKKLALYFYSIPFYELEPNIHVNRPESEHYETMKRIIKTLKAMSFYDRALFRDAPFKGYVSAKLLTKLENEVPYSVLYLDLFKEVTKEFVKYQKENRKTVENLREENERKTEEIIEKEKRITELEKLDVVEELREELKQKGERLEKAEQELAKKERECGLNNGIIEKIKAESFKLQHSVEKSKLKKVELYNAIRKSEGVIELKEQELRSEKEKVKELGKKLINVKETYDKHLVQLLNVKELVAKIKKENLVLKEEIDRNALRAAVTFEELTPRPDYNKLLEKHGLNFGNNSHQKFICQKKTRFSTIEAVDDILSQLKKVENDLLLKGEVGLAKRKAYLTKFRTTQSIQPALLGLSHNSSTNPIGKTSNQNISHFSSSGQESPLGLEAPKKTIFHQKAMQDNNEDSISGNERMPSIDDISIMSQNSPKSARDEANSLLKKVAREKNILNEFLETHNLESQERFENKEE